MLAFISLARQKAISNRGRAFTRIIELYARQEGFFDAAAD